MVQGVAHRPGKGFGKGLELFPVGAVAGDVSFVHAVPADHPPLVVVAAQPHLGDVVEAFVFSDLPGVDVTVVVHNGHGLGVLVVQGFGGFAGEQEVLVHK